MPTLPPCWLLERAKSLSDL